MSWNSRIAGLMVAVAAGGAILAGMAVQSTAGAGTDVVVRTATPTPSATPLTTASPTAVPANPPESVIEAPAAPGTDPSGGLAGVNGGPGALPSTGDGSSLSRAVDTSGAALLAIMGAILLGAGASVLAAKRRG